MAAKNPTGVRPDLDEIRRALDLLLTPGQVTELRALGVSTATYRRSHTVSGYFDDPEALTQAAANLAQHAQGTYLVLNPVNSALLARAANRVRPLSERDAATADTDIFTRRWLPIDLDPKRPSGISSTAVEHDAALDRARQIREALTADGWPAPIVADSGNGAHLLYRVDLPVNDDGLLKRVLAALAFRFDDELVGIDQTVFNPARIWKLYGTPARKGDSTVDRPHRLARLLEAPEETSLVSRDLLEALATSSPAAPPLPQAPGPSVDGTFDLEQWIQMHGLDVSDPLPWQGGRRWIFNVCPWNADHRNRSAYIVQFASGAIAAGCHHNGCAGESWQTLRELFEPNRSRARGEPRASVPHTSNGQVAQVVAGRLDQAPDADLRPELDASDLDLAKITAEAWQVLLDANDPPVLFRQAGRAVRIEHDESGQPVVRPVTRDRLRYHLERVSRWTRPARGSSTSVRLKALPPGHVLADLLATPDLPLPILMRIVEAPVFAADGTLQTTPGYHPASRSFYAPQAGLTIPAVPATPSSEDLAQARAVIFDELLSDFPFASDSERAHAVALLLLPFLRDLIDGPTPLHLIEKPTPGTGGSLLADVLVLPATGHAIPAMTEGRDEDEWRKRITAKLLSGSPIALVDNVRQPLDSAAVAAALTATTWEDRVLGVSELAHLPVQVVWIATGNNPQLSNEMTRRTVRIRLDANLDQPWLRTGFRHRDLRNWAREHRGDLIWAALVLGQAWIAAGRPRGKKTLGMFEVWSAVMGGVLEVAGIPGFLGNLTEFYAASDAERTGWQIFFSAWWERFEGREVGVASLVQVAETIDILLEIGEGNETSKRTRLGMQLVKMRDRQFRIQLDDGRAGQVRLVDAGRAHHSQRWRLTDVRGDLGGPGGRLAPVAATISGPSSLSEYDAGSGEVPQVPPGPPEGMDATDAWNSNDDEWGEA